MLEQVLVAEDETVEVGAVLAIVGDGTGTAPQAPTAIAQQAAADAPPAAASAEPSAQGEGYGGPAAEVGTASPDGVPPTPVPAESQPAPAPAAPAAPAGHTTGERSEVRLPALGESVTEGTVTRWLKTVGDHVEVDEPLLEISTDKVDTEIPSPVAGVLEQVLVAEDETVEVGAVLAIVGAGTSPVPAPATPAPAVPAAAAAAAAVPAHAAASAASAAAAADAEAPAGAGSSAPASGTAYLTPLVRKLAAEKAVDLGTVRGTGVGGRIRKEDVLEAAARAEAERTEVARAEAERAEAARTHAAGQAGSPSTTPAGAAVAPVSPLRGTTQKASRLRQVIAQRMVEALHSQAQLTTVIEVDVTKVARLRARAKDDFAAREGVKLTYLPFFVLAAVEALKTHPKINALLTDTTIVYPGEENVGIAVDTDRGLVVPVIRAAGDLNLAGIARKIADLAARTRANKVTPDELSGATFTITNTGSGGALFDTPIVPGGTSAILGTGAIVKRPVVTVDTDGAEAIAIRSMCYLVLSYDHRLVDGADASRYLATVKQRIEEGAFEAELGL